VSGLSTVQSWLADRLTTVAQEGRVPGATVAVLAGDEVIEAATGVLSTATGVETTTDSVFQIGSVTKLWTATLVMQLVDDGLLDLDKPVQSVVPEFRVVDADASAAITTRQLLSHVAGFEGDLFTDTGRNDDCVEKYLAHVAELGQLFTPGERFSYNNAGYIVLGRIVEVLRGAPYNAVLRDRLFGPLALQHTATHADEAILHRAAVGHVSPEPDTDPVPAPIWSLAPSNAPAGSMLAMSARDLLRFVQMHLADGKAADGTTVLSAESAAAMRTRAVELPFLGMMGDAWGLGFELFDLDGGFTIGHDGGTIGQAAFLRIVPEAGVAVALLTNGGNPFPLYREVVGSVLAEVAGVRLPEMPTPPQQRLPIDDADRFVGTYEALVTSNVVDVDGDGRMWVTSTPLGIAAEIGHGTPERYELVRLRGDTFVSAEPRMGMHLPLAFVGGDGAGRVRYMHQGRAIVRTA
jgi:CubicO group peptidase (beta-lactamase class C family)